MTTRVSSPRLIGRTTELDLLVTAFKAAATEERAATFLIGGEAGVGKTRLVTELGAHVEAGGGLVAVGTCLELVDRAMPFGPVVQALRDLHRRLDPATQTAVVGDAQPALARLLPELAGGVRTDDVDDGAALFEHLLATLQRLGDHVPTLLVLEDLHWADHSTRDFLVFLARNLRDARVLVVGTFRTDDLHRRHPLRPVLAELDRSGAAHRLDLVRFDRDEIGELIAAIRGESAAADLVDSTFERSDGNAFFAEELLAAEEMCEDTLPDSLRDIVLARVDALTDAAQRALRVVAVIGRTADYRLVSAVAQIPEAELTEGLRDAVAHQVLIAEPDALAYRFRHALVYETVYDDLLPSERVQLHARIAELLGERPDWFDGDEQSLASELACHWDAAHDQRRALPAALAAARAAAQMFAYPEALSHAERALTLWEHVADAAELTGLSYAAMLRFTATLADNCGNTERALAFARAALDAVDEETDPIEAALVHERIGRYMYYENYAPDDLLEHNRKAVRLVPEVPPSVERAQVLATLGQQLMVAGRNPEAIETCEVCIAVARAVGARVIEGHAHNTLGSALSGLGHLEAGQAELAIARDIALETESWGDLARAAANASANVQAFNRHEEAVAIALEGAEQARRHGLDRACGAFLRINAGVSLYELGRWDEMEEQLREADAIEGAGVDELRSAHAWATLFAGRGQFDAAEAQIQRGRSLLRGSTNAEVLLEFAMVEARVRAWSGDRAAAFLLAEHAFEERVFASSCSDAGPALLAVAAAVSEDDTAIAAVVATLDRWVAESRWGGGEPGDVRLIGAQIAAELHRTDPDVWRAVADAWAQSARIPNATYARYREAAAHVAVSDHRAAEETARDAYAMATTVGFVPIAQRIEALARQANLDLGTPVAPTSEAERVGLTIREREVLALVSAGRTNRQIGEELFISTKTASVHVSNILAKLQVANRGEAAAAARRLGLDR